MAQETIRVTGLREFERAILLSEGKLREGVPLALHEAGEIVAKDVRPRLAPYSEATAAGVVTQVSKSRSYAGTVYVLQSRRKTRVLARRRPNYGGLQMRHGFLPALSAKAPEVELALEALVDSIVSDF